MDYILGLQVILNFGIVPYKMQRFFKKSLWLVKNCIYRFDEISTLPCFILKQMRHVGIREIRKADCRGIKHQVPAVQKSIRKNEQNLFVKSRGIQNSFNLVVCEGNNRV